MTKRIFVSYAHEDSGWCMLLRSMLESAHHAQAYDVWIDEDSIRAGDRWSEKIDAGLREADAAFLLLSTPFLRSRFISDVELPRLRARHAAGMPVVPVLIGNCLWESVPWLRTLQFRPKGATEQPGSINDPASGAAVQAAKDIVAELTEILRNAEPAGAGPVPPRRAAERMLAQVLLAAQDEDSRERIAERLVADLSDATGLEGVALFNAARLFIEFHLLRGHAPYGPQNLLGSLARLPADPVARELLNALKRGAESADYSRIPIPVDSMFFMLARERESAWQAYFEAQRDPAIGALPENEVGSLALIEARWGFMVPHFLVAGLMARFDDDWRPILSVYRHSLPAEGARDAGFASLQASQWNCWLVWGPSVPICRCAQWGGRYAFQYGYGDENNSLPLIDTVAEPDASPLDELARNIVAQGQSAAVARLFGRLRWGPYLMRPAETPDPSALPQEREVDDDFGPDDEDVRYEGPEVPPARPTPRIALADAQAPALCGDGSGRVDGLLLELSSLEAAPARRAYFSAYLWLMFLVACRESDDAGPRLLWRQRYPEWPDPPSDRAKVRSERLWRHLLPVFVHANIADPAALAAQRRTLVESALAMLRGVWQARHTFFDGDDVSRGLGFHLVCASDYSGCGDALRFPPRETTAALLAERLERESDRDFAAAVVLPPAGETPQTRPWGLAAYFSSCHLGDIVADYFDHAARLKEEQRRR